MTDNQYCPYCNSTNIQESYNDKEDYVFMECLFCNDEWVTPEQHHRNKARWDEMKDASLKS